MLIYLTDCIMLQNALVSMVDERRMGFKDILMSLVHCVLINNNILFVEC